MTPGIIIGGKIFGWFTATESACIAVLYAAVLSLVVYREMSAKGLYDALLDTASWPASRCSASALPARSVGCSPTTTSGSHPERSAGVGYGFCRHRLLHRLCVPGSRLLPRCDPRHHHLAPILEPLAKAVSMDPVHFAMIGIVSLAFGLVTPPYGLVPDDRVLGSRHPHPRRHQGHGHHADPDVAGAGPGDRLAKGLAVPAEPDLARVPS
jgi:hypothetical protein